MRYRQPDRRKHTGVSPWWRNAVTAWEIALAAPQVIAHRSARMAAGSFAPNTRHREELARMHHEKVEAFSESFVAMATQTALFNQRLILMMFQFWWGPWLGFAWPTLYESFAAKNRLGRELSDSFSKLVQEGLKPVHKTVTDNVRRLGKVTKH